MSQPICSCGGKTIAFILGKRCCGRCKQPLPRNRTVYAVARCIVGAWAVR